MTICTPDGNYPVAVVKDYGDFSDRFRSLVKSRVILIVTHQRIRKLHGKSLAEMFDKWPGQIFWHFVPEGERSKSLDRWKSIIDKLTSLNADRDITLLGFGGGVVLDLTGFAAATFMRGVSWMAVPTTYLAQVDASIGGKTGIDLPRGKNLVGAFWQPKAVIVNPGVLTTLPKARVFDGLVEMAKVALVANSKFADQLEAAPDAAWDFNISASPLIIEAIKTKAKLINADVRDRGIRTLLNYGHTLGHALEAASQYMHISHGIAVREGIRFSLILGEKFGTIKENDLQERTIDLLEGLKIPRPKVLPPVKLVAKALEIDKKRIGLKTKMVLPVRWGEATIREIDSRVIKKEALTFLAG